MLACLTREEIDQQPALRDQMFRHRRQEFYDRLGWDLDIDGRGREIDEYDELNPLYVILKDEEGNHQASGRLLPTTYKTMIEDHFSEVIDPAEYVSSHCWEVTRVFVAHRDAQSVRKAAALMWAGCQIGLSVGVSSFVSITPRFMARAFAACGWSAQILHTQRDNTGNDVCACRWPLNRNVLQMLYKRSQLTSDCTVRPATDIDVWTASKSSLTTVGSPFEHIAIPKQTRRPDQFAN